MKIDMSTVSGGQQTLFTWTRFKLQRVQSSVVVVVCLFICLF